MKPTRGRAGKNSSARTQRARKAAASSSRSKARSRSNNDGSAPAVLPDSSSADLIAAADALFRCAEESCRQHHRVARLIAGGASDQEQQVAWQVAALCDALLRQVTELYAPVAAQTKANRGTEVRRCANALWRASRAFTNRFLDEDRQASESKREHSSEDFRDLRLHHELDASSILSLKQATEEYRRARPAAALSVGDGRWENGE